MDRLEDLGVELIATMAGGSPRIAIVGGGYAGLAAAVRLAELGHRSILFEGGRVLGGRARRIEYRGTVLDNGQHILSGAYTELLRMMALVGVPSSATMRSTLNLTILPGFHLRAPRLPAPLHLAWALLAARGLKLADRWAAIRLMRGLAKSRFQVDVSWTVSNLLSHFRQPAELVDRLWQPLTIAALNTPLKLASAQVFANVLRDALGSRQAASDLILPRVDLSALFPEPAAAWLNVRGSQVRLGSRVHGILHNQESKAGKWEIGISASPEAAANHFETFECIILAVAPHQLSAIELPDVILPPSFRYEPIYTVYLQYSRPVTLPHPMVGRVTGHGQWWFDREQLSRNRGLVAAVISASGDHERLGHQELALLMHQELEAITGPMSPPLWHKVIAEKFATFACTPAMQRPACDTGLPGLYLAGDYVECDYPATLEAAVRNGVAAAEHANASLLKNASGK